MDNYIIKYWLVRSTISYRALVALMMASPWHHEARGSVELCSMSWTAVDQRDPQLPVGAAASRGQIVPLWLNFMALPNGWRNNDVWRKKHFERCFCLEKSLKSFISRLILQQIHVH